MGFRATLEAYITEGTNPILFSTHYFKKCNDAAKDLYKAFFSYFMFGLSSISLPVIWLYEHNWCYAGENREEQNVSFLLS